jgi:arylsulfatase A-like enzyme
MFFQSDNGPSRETRNWLDGTTQAYHGGKGGTLKGHKFSLYDGGIRVPALMCWPARIPAGRVVGHVGAAMDVFPTFLKAAGGDLSQYESDGCDILPMAADGAEGPHDCVFWEMDEQTAVRRGKWKLVLNGKLAGGTPPEDAVHLCDLETDPKERTNLKDQYREIVAELQTRAETWRQHIEERWQREWLPRVRAMTSQTSPSSS